MLFHNVYAMSSATNTPTRPARGMPVPVIDTKPHVDKAASLSFGGWPHTPPQSAHESRRPSLAYSALSDASHSGPSSVSGYSQPATPVHGMNHHNDFTQQWSDGTDVHASMSMGLADTCSGAQVPQQQSFASAFQQRSMCNLSVPNGLPGYAPTGQDNVASFGMDLSPESPMRDAWSQQQMTTGFNGHSGMRTTLFQSTPGFGQDTSSSASMYANPAHSIHTGLGASVFPNYDAAGPTLNTNIYQTPQVVVPSQLSPHEDYPMDNYPGYDQQEIEDGYTESFDSSVSGFGAWEHVRPQSPLEAYIEHAEEGFDMVKHEPATPSRGPSQTRNFFNSGPSQHHPRRTGSTKRGSRRSKDEGKCWGTTNVHNMEVRFEGKKFQRVQAPDGSYQYLTEGRKGGKPHKCTFPEADGSTCNSSFERSEHLKRHMTKHSKERNYKCPLEGCKKEIARPDNAADHFRTHLRLPGKGKRNKHCEFEHLEEAINLKYNEKMAKKLIENLRKWFYRSGGESEVIERAKRERKMKEGYFQQ